MTEELGLSLFKIAFWLYVIATGGYLVGFIQNSTVPAKLGRCFLLLGLAVHTASLVVITVAIGRAPFFNMYEYMLSFTWAAAVVYAAVELTTSTTSFGAFCLPVILALAYCTDVIPRGEIDKSVLPVLKTWLIIPHVATAILAYGAFGIALVLAILYLIREAADTAPGKRKETSFWASRLPIAQKLDQIVYRTVAFGFLMQTLVLITGAVWAQVSWGHYWTWDPVEVWALITWLIYATYLHTRMTLGWRGRRSAWLAIIGFAVVGFTLWGVTYLLKGLHTYA